MNIKNRIGLSLFISILYVLLIEAFYIINASSFTFRNTLSFIDNDLFKYLCIIIITSLFYFLNSYLLFPLFKKIKDIKIYIILGSIFFVIHNVFLRFSSLLPTNGLLISEISLYFVIIFTTTVFFYSITYFNLLK